MDERGSGWLVFSGIILMVAGVMRVIDAIWAFQASDSLRFEDGLVGDTLTNYAWLWLIVGVVLFLSGIAVIQRSQFARWIGIIASAIAAISALAWMPYYPIWSLTYIAIAIAVIYGLSAYGGREVEA